MKIGEPTEAALKTLVEKFGSDDVSLNKSLENNVEKMSPAQKLERAGKVDRHFESKYKRLATLEFSRNRKSMSVLVEKSAAAPAFGAGNSKGLFGSGATGTTSLFVKGAPEQIVERCTHVRHGDKSIPLTDRARRAILSKVFLF